MGRTTCRHFRSAIALVILLALIVIASAFLTACGTAATPASPTKAPSTVATAQTEPTGAPPKPTEARNANAPQEKASAPAAKPAPAPKTAKIAYPTGDMSFLPFYVAKEEGFLKEEGVDLELVLMPGAVAVKAVIAGELDGTLSGGSALAAAFQGAPIKVVGATYARAMYWLYAKPSIKKLADLKGKSIAIDAIGGSMDSTTRQVLSEAGLKTEDVAFIGLASTARPAALKSGSVDGAVLTPGDLPMARQGGFNELAFIGEKVPFLVGGLAVTDRVMSQNPDTIKGLIKGSIKAMKLMKANKTVGVKHIMAFLKMDKDAAESVYDSAVQYYADDALISDSDLKTIIDTQRKQLKIERDIPIASLFNLSLAKVANDEIKAAGWSPKK